MAVPNHLQKIPHFTGEESKDQFSAELWMARIVTTAQAVPWADDITLTMAVTALRGEALTWHQVMSQRGIQGFNTWAVFRPLFLQHFGKRRTSTTTTAILDGLKQKSGETVMAFFLRVGIAADDIKALTPDLGLPPVADRWTADFAGLAGWNALGNDIKETLLNRYQARGSRHAEEGFATQLFIAGLRPEIRDRLLNQAPPGGFATLVNAMERATEVEKNLQTNGRGAHVNAVDDDDDQDVDALHRRGGQRGRGRGQRGRGSSRGGGGNKNNGKKFEGKCYHCNKVGHKKEDCYAYKKTQGKKVHATDQQNEPVRSEPFKSRYNDDSDDDDNEGQDEVGCVGSLNC